MSGPFATEREARESVRHIIDPAAYGSITQRNRALLRFAVTSVGIEPGAYDRQVIDWASSVKRTNGCAIRSSGRVTSSSGMVKSKRNPYLNSGRISGIRVPWRGLNS
jgi:hypothetical protein